MSYLHICMKYNVSEQGRLTVLLLNVGTINPYDNSTNDVKRHKRHTVETALSFQKSV